MELTQGLGLKIDKKINHYKNAKLEIKGGVSALTQVAGILTKQYQDGLKDEAKVDKEKINYSDVLHILKTAASSLEKQIYGATSKLEILENVLDEIEQDFKAEELKLKGYSMAEKAPEIIEKNRPIGIRPVPLKKVKGQNGADQPIT